MTAEADNSRFSTKFINNTGDSNFLRYAYVFDIQNPTVQDSGVYACCASITTSDGNHYYSFAAGRFAMNNPYPWWELITNYNCSAASGKGAPSPTNDYDTLPTTLTQGVLSTTSPKNIADLAQGTPHSTPSLDSADLTQNNCITTITILAIPIVVAIVAIIADILLIWKVLEQKKIISTKLKNNDEKDVDGKGIDGPYMELQKTQAEASSREYMDLKPKEDLYSEAYEDIDESRPQGLNSDRRAYVNVKK